MGARCSIQTAAVSSCASAMIGASRASLRSMQLRLDLTEGPAPAAALWELLGDSQRSEAMAILAALIAKTVLPEEPGSE